MKKFYSAALCLFLICTLCTLRVAAAPSAEITATLSEPVIAEDGTQIITLYISIATPSEPYASLDFNLVSSSAEHLSVASKSETGDQSDLDVTFTSDYGGAYHEGRIDEESGSISYLMGIFSFMGGNAIEGEVDICTVRLRYSGQEPQTLSINDLKLIYKTADGQIVSETMPDDVSLAVMSTISFNETGIPLSSGPVETEDNLLLYVLIGTGLLIVCGIIIILVVRKRKTTSRKITSAVGTNGN